MAREAIAAVATIPHIVAEPGLEDDAKANLRHANTLGWLAGIWSDGEARSNDHAGEERGRPPKDSAYLVRAKMPHHEPPIPPPCFACARAPLRDHLRST
jgi:hypothetical protein